MVKTLKKRLKSFTKLLFCKKI